MRLFYILSLVLAMSSCEKEEYNSSVIVPLSAAEIEDLTFLREEEKLARDVYLYAYDVWGATSFSNISNSEQKHMNAVLSLLNKYDIPDSASSENGVFNNAELQALYSSLTEKVDLSLADALTVGATIEDLDISDINHFLDNTSKSDLLTVYNNLNCGSQNHMRSFNSNLTALGETYEAQFISADELQTILAASNGGCGN